MKNRRMRLTGTVLALMLVVSMGASVSAEISNAAVLFLKLENSARAAAMGRVSTVMVDAQSALYNPGAMGLFHLDKAFSVTVPGSNGWLPELSDDISLKSGGVSLGGSPSYFGKEVSPDFNFSLGIAYSELRLDYGTLTRTGNTVDAIGKFEPYDKAECYSFAAGVEIGRVLYAGIGYTHKNITSLLAEQGAGVEISSFKSDGSAHDYGVMLQVRPLNRLVPEYAADGGFSQFRFAAVPSFAYVKQNIGDDMVYIDAAAADPLPKTRQLGAGLLLGVTLEEAPLVSANFVYEQEKDLVSSEADTLGLGSHTIDKSGFELGLLGFVYVRAGRYNDHGGLIDMDTQGFGFSLRGALDWLERWEVIRPGDGVTGRVLRTFDLRVDYGEYDDPGGPLDNTDFFQVSLSL